MVFVDANGERTITTLGRRLEPTNADDLPWDELEAVDAVYFTAGDVAALREARRAKVLVATSRVADLLAEADLHLDAVVGSGNDPSEAFDPARLTHPTRTGRSDRRRSAAAGTRPTTAGAARTNRRRHPGPSSTRTGPATRSRQD